MSIPGLLLPLRIILEPLEAPNTIFHHQQEEEEVDYNSARFLRIRALVLLFPRDTPPACLLRQLAAAEAAAVECEACLSEVVPPTTATTLHHHGYIPHMDLPTTSMGLEIYH